jgi:hypothetical protein
MPGANGAKESLWAMMETSRGVGIALLNDEKTHAGDNGVEAPVYFDCKCWVSFRVYTAYTWQIVFGRVFFVFTQHALLMFDLGLLVLGPLFLLFLHNSKAVWWLEQLVEFRRLGWTRNVWTWAKFWVVVILGFLLQAVLVMTFLKINKYVRSAFMM